MASTVARASASTVGLSNMRRTGSSAPNSSLIRDIRACCLDSSEYRLALPATRAWRDPRHTCVLPQRPVLARRTRRPCLDTGHYEPFNQPNVHRIDCVADPIVEVTVWCPLTQSGETDLDMPIL